MSQNPEIPTEATPEEMARYSDYLAKTRKQKLAALARAGAFPNASPADVQRLIEGK